nr:alpha/beta hydrolase [Prevotella sp.]
MRNLFITILAITVALSACAKKQIKEQRQLVFDPSKGKVSQLTMPQGDIVHFTAYEHLFYVTNVEDTTYQYMNVFVPERATQDSPIFLRTYVGGYMASKATYPQAGDASGRAL